MGKLIRRKKSKNGFVLLDVLIALLIAGTALVITLGDIAFAARTVKLSKDRIIELISTRNENAYNKEIIFSQELFEE